MTPVSADEKVLPFVEVTAFQGPFMTCFQVEVGVREPLACACCCAGAFSPSSKCQGGEFQPEYHIHSHRELMVVPALTEAERLGTGAGGKEASGLNITTRRSESWTMWYGHAGFPGGPSGCAFTLCVFLEEQSS